MMIHILPGLIMFSITLIFVTMFFIPITKFKQKNELVSFYWVGVWMFLALIAAFSGAAETLGLFRYDVALTSDALLAALSLCFVIFVVFGWFRLSFKAMKSGITLWLSKRA